MRYYGEEALGLVETIGLTPALEAADKMLKAADVELISYENVGSTLVTIMVKGDVAAVRSSVEADNGLSVITESICFERGGEVENTLPVSFVPF